MPLIVFVILVLVIGFGFTVADRWSEDRPTCRGCCCGCCCNRKDHHD